MININEYPNIASVLKRIAQMQDFGDSDPKDALDAVIYAYCPTRDGLSEDELELATAAMKVIELPEYLKNKNINM